jgi:hypothetical protein
LKYFIETSDDPDPIALAKKINSTLAKPLRQGKWMRFPDVQVRVEGQDLVLTYNVATLEQAEQIRGISYY